MCPAKKDTEAGLVDFSAPVGADAAVTSLLTSAGRRQAEARLSKPERARKVRERRRQKERMNGRIGLDLPVGMKERLVRLAERESVPISQLVAFLLAAPLQEFEQAQNPLWGYTRPSRCAKFEFTIDVEKRIREQK
mgnify:FL=1